jgi:hypothetical protein
MANTFKVLARQAAPTTQTTVYTTPSGVTTLITSIVVTNNSTVSRTYNIWLNNIGFAQTATIPASDSIIIDTKQVLPSGQALSISASATSVLFHISGLEIEN